MTDAPNFADAAARLIDLAEAAIALEEYKTCLSINLPGMTYAEHQELTRLTNRLAAAAKAYGRLGVRP